MPYLLYLQELAELLGRSHGTIKKDLRRNPMAVPPQAHVPGARLLRWRRADVESLFAGFMVGGGE
ncbi:helix-turn-helix domain-containing protein [Caballeronia sp. GAFFF1]|uniref:helix-turn-helix transcriptional regulator n=1 Tax=Caballeronia sp. GAFFF1 TaxID=2921779 RepID=UPI0020277585|nr:helix-turn-helix domain-containing protein [Caballeronia sp. GAFFF1]